MSFADRFVFDTSSLIGAVLRPGSVPRRAFQEALLRGTLCASSSTLAELETVLMRGKLDVYQTQEKRLKFLRDYRVVLGFLRHPNGHVTVLDTPAHESPPGGLSWQPTALRSRNRRSSLRDGQHVSAQLEGSLAARHNLVTARSVRRLFRLPIAALRGLRQF